MSEFEPLIESWIRFHHAEMNSNEYENDFWSFDKLSEFCRKDPTNAWWVIVEIYEKRPGEKIISNLAAGPLEDLLVNHGRLALVWIDQYCQKERGFIEALVKVWQNSIPEDIWSDLKKLINRHS